MRARSISLLATGSLIGLMSAPALADDGARSARSRTPAGSPVSNRSAWPTRATASAEVRPPVRSAKSSESAPPTRSKRPARSSGRSRAHHLSGTAPVRPTGSHAATETPRRVWQMSSAQPSDGPQPQGPLSGGLLPDGPLADLLPDDPPATGPVRPPAASDRAVAGRRSEATADPSEPFPRHRQVPNNRRQARDDGRPLDDPAGVPADRRLAATDRTGSRPVAVGTGSRPVSVAVGTGSGSVSVAVGTGGPQPLLAVALSVCLDLDLLHTLDVHLAIGACGPAAPPEAPPSPPPPPAAPPASPPAAPPPTAPPPARPPHTAPPAAVPPGAPAVPVRPVGARSVAPPPRATPSRPPAPSSSAPVPEPRKPTAVYVPHRKKPLATLTVIVVLAVMVAVGAGLAFATV